MDLTSLLQGAIGEQIASGIASQLGVKEGQAQSAISTALPVLITTLNKNAQSGDADNISKALERDHDGSILDNVGSYLSGGNFSDGAGILSHILGSKQSQVENAVSKTSGLSGAQTSKLLMILAPIIMGYLGKQKQSQSAGGGGITDLLGSVLSGLGSGSGSGSGFPQIDMIESILNPSSSKKSGGGLLGGLLGGLFGGK